MKKKILFGSLLAVVLLVLLSFSPSITADVSKQDIDVVEDVATPTPLALAFQLMHKLRNYPEIQNVETEDELLQIIEGDEELNSIFEQLSTYSCGCEDDTTEFRWPFPIICFVFGFPLIILALLANAAGQAWVGAMVWIFGYMFNCFWY